MDTKTLVVGQEVFVVSGCYYSNGKVVKVTQEGVEVQLARNKVIWQFDTKGMARDGVGTAEYGPYIIDDMPFEERKAELMEAELRREFLHKKYPDGSVIPANEPLPPIFDGPFWYEGGMFECGPVLDTTKLVVGQEVSMSSGVYGCEGKVVKVTPDGVEVQTNYAGLLHFDSKGRGRDDEGTYENGAYYIDYMSPAEISARYKQTVQRLRDSPFIAWWKRATYKQRLVLKKYHDRLHPQQVSSCVQLAQLVGLVLTTDISSNLYLVISLASEVNMHICIGCGQHFLNKEARNMHSCHYECCPTCGGALRPRCDGLLPPTVEVGKPCPHCGETLAEVSTADVVVP